MKKTAYFMSSWPVWSETFIRNELALLLEEGVPLHPMAVFPGNMPADASGIPVQIIRPGAPISHSRPNILGHAWLKGQLRRQLSLMRHSPTLNLVQRAMLDAGIEHIHSAFAGFPAMLASGISRKLKISYSVSAHAADVFCCKYDDAFLFKKATAVFCCNQGVLDALSHRSPWLSDRLLLLPHGVDLTAWPVPMPERVPADPLRFLFIGRLVKKKDPLAAARLIRDLVRFGIPAELTVVGDGDLRQAMQNEVDGYACHFHGVVADHEIPQLMERHDFLLSTSRELPSGDQEGIPNVILEAMAAGLPVLASMTGSIPEVVTGNTGWGIAPHNPESFIRTIQSVVQDHAERERRRQQARHLVEAQYDARKLAKGRAEQLRAAAG